MARDGASWSGGFFPDPTKNGLPHALEGMIKEVTVS